MTKYLKEILMSELKCKEAKTFLHSPFSKTLNEKNPPLFKSSGPLAQRCSNVVQNIETSSKLFGVGAEKRSLGKLRENATGQWEKRAFSIRNISARFQVVRSFLSSENQAIY